ncbi:MAG: hypothetical protein EB053_02350 [Chlamydiae bacterium]|nr:hypothetical protein [Chlamydiota bacterium]
MPLVKGIQGLEFFLIRENISYQASGIFVFIWISLTHICFNFLQKSMIIKGYRCQEKHFRTFLV